jgi:hypothetical protein
MICEFNIILIVVFNFINQQFIYFWMGSKWITCFYPVYGIFAPFLRKAHAPLIVSHHLLYCLVQSTWVYNFVSTGMPLISSAIRYCSIFSACLLLMLQIVIANTAFFFVSQIILVMNQKVAMHPQLIMAISLSVAPPMLFVDLLEYS